MAILKFVVLFLAAITPITSSAVWADLLPTSEFPTTFWAEEFGVMYYPGQSGIVLSNGEIVDGAVAWQASATEMGASEPQVVSSGTFIEEFRSSDFLEIPESALAWMGITDLTSYVVSGVFLGYTGSEAVTVYGILSELVLSGSQDIGFVFIPLGVTEDSTDAIAQAVAVYEAIAGDFGEFQRHGTVPPPHWGRPTLVTPPKGWKDCDAEVAVCLRAADDFCAACIRKQVWDRVRPDTLACIVSGGIAGEFGPLIFVACEGYNYYTLYRPEIDRCQSHQLMDYLTCGDKYHDCDRSNNRLLGWTAPPGQQSAP